MYRVAAEVTVEVVVHLEHGDFHTFSRQQQAQHLDRLLWTFKDQSFLPHGLVEKTDLELTPILIGQGEPPMGNTQVLINLGSEVPAFFERFERLCELVDHPSLRAHYDTHHMHIEERDAGAAVETCAPVLGHVHLSENDRGVPGQGQVDWNGTFAALKAANYDGWCVIEAFSRLDPDFAGAIHVWRDYFADPDDVCRDGLQFVKAGLLG